MVSRKISKHIAPLHVNGMDGRILRMPPPKGKTRQIFLLYGHHASLERMAGLAEVLSRYGAVTMPDLPGFGGMDSFYKIGHRPTLDDYADYLASLIKLYYKRRRLTIFAMSFSVPLVVRMLQKYPDLARKVDIFISIAGFVRHDDFTFNKSVFWSLRSIARTFTYRLPAAFMSNVILTKPVISNTYKVVSGRHSKMKDAIDVIERDRRIEYEVNLWKMNDVRTRMSTMSMMFKMDLCSGPEVGTPVYHVTATEDRYFDHNVVEQHLRIIFKKVKIIPSEMANHAPTIVATAKEAAPYIPKEVRRLLR